MAPVGSGEVIRVGDSAPAGVPVEFTWRGRRYAVRAVDNYQTPKPGGRGKRLDRATFRIRTTSGLRCLVSVDVSRGLWCMERVLPNGGE